VSGCNRRARGPYPPFPSTPVPFASLPSLPLPFIPLPSPPFPSLRSRPPKLQLRGVGERCKLASGVWGDLVHFSRKSWHLVATISIISLIINWSNFVHFMIYDVQGQMYSACGGLVWSQMRGCYLKSGGLQPPQP